VDFLHTRESTNWKWRLVRSSEFSSHFGLRSQLGVICWLAVRSLALGPPPHRWPAGTPFIIRLTANTSSPHTTAATKRENDVCLKSAGISWSFSGST